MNKVELTAYRSASGANFATVHIRMQSLFASETVTHRSLEIRFHAKLETNFSTLLEFNRFLRQCVRYASFVRNTLSSKIGRRERVLFKHGENRSYQQQGVAV
jgi:hypothetical protein